MNKYYIYMQPQGDVIEDTAAAQTTVTTMNTIMEPQNRLVFWHEGTEIGTLDWEQGYVRFDGDVDESARQLATVAGGRFHTITQAQKSEIAEARKMIADLLALLNNTQFEDTRSQAALDYLHKHEFFENRIRGT